MTAPVPGTAFSAVVLSGVTETATDSASQFCQQSTGASCLASPHTLPTGSLSESAPGVSGPAPLPSVYALSGIDGTTATLASAADKTSSGTYTFTGATLTLTVAPTTYAAQYVSTITYTLVSGP
jgi:hypothetical protein